jgi:uncharacterized membrane protein
MDLSAAVMFGFVGLIALNYTVPRVDAVRHYPALFWAINGLNAAAAVGLLLFGGGLVQPIVRFMIGLVLLMHLAQNFAVRARWDSEARHDRLEEEYRARLAADDPGEDEA